MAPNVETRTVHGRDATGREIVRYDKAGKWYIETEDSRQKVTVREAAEAAIQGTHSPGLSGGRTFDMLYERLLQAHRRRLNRERWDLQA